MFCLRFCACLMEVMVTEYIMRLFGRWLSKPNGLDTESAVGVKVIRRIKVTTDRYWVTSEIPVVATPEQQAEAVAEAKLIRPAGPDAEDD